jgi:hypothetical protein
MSFLIKRFHLFHFFTGKGVTNNSLEALHLNLKQTHTENKKLTTAAFLKESINIIREYSRKAYNADWVLKPAGKQMWRKAIFLYKQNMWIEKEDTLYFVRSKRDPHKSNERIKY